VGRLRLKLMQGLKVGIEESERRQLASFIQKKIEDEETSFSYPSPHLGWREADKECMLRRGHVGLLAAVHDL
jgi:hypothetical protein